MKVPRANVSSQLWIDHPAAPTPGFKFTGWYFTYPSEEQHMGLVSYIADDPPALNWIFVDKDTHMIRHGSRAETLGGHSVGPWGWSSDEQWLTLEGKASEFVAVEQEDGKWAVAWDADGSIRNKGGESGEDDEGVNWLPIKLHRRMQLGMESRYVKKSEES